MVLIDDEATTGRTFANLYHGLLGAGLPRPERLVTATLTDWSGDAVRSRLEREVTPISLLSGSWHWAPNPDATLPEIPTAEPRSETTQAPINYPHLWGRLGWQDEPHRFHTATATPGEKVLVLGSAEFTWPAFQLAEQLEGGGADVVFSAITRSPIAVGHAIQSALSFSDNYGLGIPNYLYNVNHQRFDRIFLCVETPASSVDPSLINALKRISPIVEICSHDTDH